MKSFVYLIVGAVVAVLLVFLLVSSNLFTQKDLPLTTSEKKAVISGQINLNGEPEPGATLTIMTTDVNSGQALPVVKNLPAVDGVSFSWNGAIEGKNYELEAVLMINNSQVAQSENLLVTAPAMDEVLTLNLPSNPQQELAVISGNFNLNGYIPEGSTLRITAQTNKADLGNVVSGIQAVGQPTFSWNNAVKNEAYILRAYLENNGQQIGQSNEVLATAPASNEKITINSTAKPQQSQTQTQQAQNQQSQPQTQSVVPKQGGISGKIDLNGPAPANSRIVIFQRQKSTDQYTTAVDNIMPTDGVSWSWPQAQAGIQYEILGVLKLKQAGGNDLDYAYSHQLKISAPAHNEVLKINTQISLAAPTTLPTIQCNDKVSGNDNQYNATVTYQNIDSAKQYWLEVGTKENLSDVFSSRLAPTNTSPQTHQIQVDAGKNYHAAYAYSNCPDCGDISSFSSFSHWQNFICQ